MELYSYLLKFYGLRKLIERKKKSVDDEGNELEKVVVKIDETGGIKENAIKKEKRFYEKKQVRFIVNYYYRLIILCALLFECIHPIISSGMMSDIHYFANSGFAYMYLFQYIFGIMFHDEDDDDKVLEKLKKYNLYVNIAYGIGLLFSIILSIVPVFTTFSFPQFYNIFGNNLISSILFTIYIIINRFYSYNILFSNAIVFALLMIHHTMEIKAYNKSLKMMVDDNLMDINISNTITEYTDIKGKYGDSINLTNNIFASIVVFGIIGCYFTLIFIKVGYNNVYTYIDAVCAILMMVMYVTNISIISRIVNRIKNLIDSPKFISIFLNKSNFAIVRGDVYDDYNQNNLGIHPLSSPLRNKDILKDISEMPKVVSQKKLNLNTVNNLKFITMNNMEQNGNNDDQNKKIDYIKNISVRSMVLSTENGISLDWIILYSKLSDPWERFIVCGFEIDDSQLFQQLLAMAVSFLGLMEISKLIQ
jgi:hypothetical protein